MTAIQPYVATCHQIFNYDLSNMKEYESALGNSSLIWSRDYSDVRSACRAADRDGESRSTMIQRALLLYKITYRSKLCYKFYQIVGTLIHE